MQEHVQLKVIIAILRKLKYFCSQRIISVEYLLTEKKKKPCKFILECHCTIYCARDSGYLCF